MNPNIKAETRAVYEDTGRRVSAIKKIRDLTGLTLKDSTTLFRKWEAEWDLPTITYRELLQKTLTQCGHTMSSRLYNEIIERLQHEP